MSETVMCVRPQLGRVEGVIGDALSSASPHVDAPIRHLLASRGKGLRPALVILWASAVSPCSQEGGRRGADDAAVAEVAAAAELIHMASLVHDDLVDGSALRRGRETLSRAFGAKASVLIGDFLFARAFGLLARHRDLGVLEPMTEAIAAMCEGELEQAACAFSCDGTEDDYFRRITQKTAHLMAACCHVGAALARAAPDELANARAYGLHLGIAFQLTDDVLDLVADQIELGKPASQDLVSGVLTLPVLKLLSHEALGPRARKLIESREFDATSVSWVRSAVVECGGVDYAYRKAGESLDRALACARRLPPGGARDALASIAEALGSRRC